MLNFHGRHVHKYLNCRPASLFPGVADNSARNEARLDSQVPRNIPVSSDCHCLVSTVDNILFRVAFEKPAYEQARADISTILSYQWNKPGTNTVVQSRGAAERTRSLSVSTPIPTKRSKGKFMRKMLVVAAFMCASLQAQVTSGPRTRHEQPPTNTNQSVNPVI